MHILKAVFCPRRAKGMDTKMDTILDIKCVTTDYQK